MVDKETRKKLKRIKKEISQLKKQIKRLPKPTAPQRFFVFSFFPNPLTNLIWQ